MTSTDLVNGDGEVAEADIRERALAELNAAAEIASTPHEAREIMVKGRTLSEFLKQAKAPLEQARLAGRASVVAARRLGVLLSDLSPKIHKLPGRRAGFSPSERGLVLRDLGLTVSMARDYLRLATVNDPDFQRYIQQPGIVPSVNGALTACGTRPRHTSGRCQATWRAKRMRRVGVKTPKNPSLDEAYSLIVKALGHLSVEATNPKRRRDVGRAIDCLYAAEDFLQKYRGGYVD